MDLVTLPKVSVMARLGEAPMVTVDGSPVRGVRSAQVTVSADGFPQVSLVLGASDVDLVLPAGVTVLQAGPSATEFAAQLDVRRLEADALAEDDLPMGQSFARAVVAQAADFDDRG